MLVTAGAVQGHIFMAEDRITAALRGPSPSGSSMHIHSSGSDHTLNYTSGDGMKASHTFGAMDHNALLQQIHAYLMKGSPNQSLTDVSAQEAGGSQQSAGGVHAPDAGEGYFSG